MSRPLPLLLSDSDPALPLSPLPPIPGLTPAALFGSGTCPSGQLAVLSGLLLSWPFLNFSPLFDSCFLGEDSYSEGRSRNEAVVISDGPYLHPYAAPQRFSDHRPPHSEASPPLTVQHHCVDSCPSRQEDPVLASVFPAGASFT